MTGPDRFRFLNVTRTVATARDWNRPDWPRLWLYNAHYFDDLLASDAAQRSDWHRALIARWIAENPPGHGTGWEPYPTSLRIVNWIKWALSGNALNTTALHSLAVQTRWLCKRLEWHLLGNHLWANAKALVFAGLFLEGDEAHGWLDRGLRILARERPEQILPDGGHFERSPMYHAIVLEDLLDLINLARCSPAVLDADDIANWKQAAQHMLRWLATLCHPDGEIALFNDAAIGVAPTPEALFVYAGRLDLTTPPWRDTAGEFTPKPSLAHLPETGYLRYASGPLVALLDLAPIGPDHLPGHAHADTLSFELSLHGRRVIVNGGTGCYGTGAERLRQRGTAAHSTVTVDGRDSSDVWGGFRVARRARPFDLMIRETDGAIEIACSHDGYHRLPGKVTHRRHPAG